MLHPKQAIYFVYFSAYRDLGDFIVLPRLTNICVGAGLEPAPTMPSQPEGNHRGLPLQPSMNGVCKGGSPCPPFEWAKCKPRPYHAVPAVSLRKAASLVAIQKYSLEMMVIKMCRCESAVRRTKQSVKIHLLLSLLSARITAD